MSRIFSSAEPDPQLTWTAMLKHIIWLLKQTRQQEALRQAIERYQKENALDATANPST